LVLSIGKLATGQANYYLRQVGRRIDRVTSVATGVEDYYLDGGEPAGEWLGGGAAILGLQGKVDAESLHRVLAGLDPFSEKPLRATRGTRVPGFDLTFSAPKSVSVLFAIGDERIGRLVQNAHDAAVRDALGYLERVAVTARRGAGGREEIAGDGLVAAAFRHRTSRAGDPQVHTHVLIANLVRGTDGRWSALDTRRIYTEAQTAGFIYEARLRAELTAALGVEWAPIRKGIADIAGMPTGVLRAFSRRRAEIEAELRKRGEWTASAARAATLETRRAKDRLVDPRRLVAEWRERAAINGLDERALLRLLDRVQSRELDPSTIETVLTQLASAAGITRDRAYFSRRDTIRALCERLPAGIAISSVVLEQLADEFLQSDRTVPLLEPGARSHELRYSTPELLAIEQRIVEQAINQDQVPAGVAGEGEVEDALARRQFLSPEQVVMVRRLTRDGARVVAVVGKAGSGKTTALGTAREAWVASGFTVVGVAVARRAARELQESAGIKSTSLAALLSDLRRGGPFGLARGTVLVLDEASMVGTRDLGELLEYVVQVNGKLVLCGDHRQLPSIRAGGAFQAVVTRTNAIHLTENRRQLAEWERHALDVLRDGVPAEAIRVYEANERLVVGAEREAVIARLVSDWWSAGGHDQTAMIALRRADVAELNTRARILMREAGRLGPDIEFAGGTFACGDWVVLRRNERRLGVANGDVGVLVGVDAERGLAVQIGGRLARLPSSYIGAASRRPTIQHAYAITGHVAQGLTLDRAFVLGSPEIYREWGYTALSRGRQENRMYVVAADDLERQEVAPAQRDLPSARDSLVRALSSSRAQTAAIDAGQAQAIRSASSGSLRARLQAGELRSQAERQLIEDELRIRASMERSASLGGRGQQRER
jgi:conjugative relaxase-like TrwC/TraI family protein